MSEVFDQSQLLYTTLQDGEKQWNSFDFKPSETIIGETSRTNSLNFYQLKYFLLLFQLKYFDCKTVTSGRVSCGRDQSLLSVGETDI